MSNGSQKLVYRLPCGCLVGRPGEYIIEMCACCDKEWAERHTRAQVDRQSQRSQAVLA